MTHSGSEVLFQDLRRDEIRGWWWWWSKAKKNSLSTLYEWLTADSNVKIHRTNVMAVMNAALTLLMFTRLLNHYYTQRTLYRTRNRKQLLLLLLRLFVTRKILSRRPQMRKWSGKEKFWGGSEHWSWGYVGWQTVVREIIVESNLYPTAYNYCTFCDS